LRAKGATPGRAEARRGEARHRPLLSNHRFVPKLKPTAAEGTFFMSTYMPAWFGRKPVGGWAGAVPSCLWVSLGARMRAPVQEIARRHCTRSQTHVCQFGHRYICTPARLRSCAPSNVRNWTPCATTHLRDCTPALHACTAARLRTCTPKRLCLSASLIVSLCVAVSLCRVCVIRCHFVCQCVSLFLCLCLCLCLCSRLRFCLRLCF